MSASDTERRERGLPRRTRHFLAWALFCGFFSAVYEHFSHGVSSDYMVWLFAIPLAAALASLIAERAFPPGSRPGPAAGRLFDFGAAALTVGSALEGALEIYGTSSPYMPVYPAAGALLLTGALLVWIFSRRRTPRDAG